uniref:Odorant receptor n=1 Tax=Protaetia brevitarsis TaxID=348688 RepID=A0A411HR13_PROBE|nr:odorant receptor [Protaetia brevitarsis]
MGAYNTDLFYINDFFLKCAAVWPINHKTGIKHVSYKIYQFFVITVTLVLFPTSLFVNVAQNVDNLLTFMEILYPAVIGLLSAAKVYFSFMNCDRIKRVMYSLECNDFHYEKIENFDPCLIMKRAKLRGIITTMTMWCLCQLTLFLTYGSPIVKSFWYYIKDMPIGNVTTFQTLPTRLHPLFQCDTALKYLIACLLQFILFSLYILVIVGFDGLFMNLLNIIGEHMVILQGAFRTIRNRCLLTISGIDLGVDELEERMMIEMKKCIRHLQMIFQCCADTEEIFKYICLIQSTATLLQFCDCLMLLSLTDFRSTEFRMYASYSIAIVTELSLYCWSGNNLTSRAIDIPLGLWESDWLETRKPFKVCMLITMIRLQKPTIFTAGNIVPLLLTTQVSILKAGYSYFTVLSGR